MKFSTKLNSLTIVLLIACTAILGAISWYLLVREVMASRTRYANQMAALLLSNPSVAVAMHQGDNAQLGAYFDEVVSRQKDLLFIALVKQGGTFLVDTSRGEAPQRFAWSALLASNGSRAIRGAVHRGVSFRGRDEDVYLALLPIFSQGVPWGTAALGFSFRELYQTTLPKVFMMLAGLWATLAAVCSLVLFLFVHALTQPVRDLMLGVKVISAGNFDYPVQVRSRDELGALGAMFDQMRLSLRETFGRLQQNASVDEITHLYNQNFFRTLLDQELARARRYKYPVTLLLVRLANFEALKQAYGAEFKSALGRLAQALQGCIRNTDNLARYREDTFAIVLTQSDRRSSQPVHDRVVAALREFPRENARVPEPAARLGWAEAVPAAPEVTQTQLLAKAESELTRG